MTRKTGPKAGRKADPSRATRDRLLEAALPDAVFDGWTDALLARAREKAGVSPQDAQAAFPDGAHGLARHFSDWADHKTIAQLTKRRLEPLRVRDKIALGVRTRLELLEPHKQAVSSALGFFGLPPRSLELPKMVWNTADALWRAAGDTATDYNHYTKRLLLCGVLTSTTLYWLNDSSDGHENTWAFLDRRIEEVLAVGRRLSSFRKPAESKIKNTAGPGVRGHKQQGKKR